MGWAKFWGCLDSHVSADLQEEFWYLSPTCVVSLPDFLRIIVTLSPSFQSQRDTGVFSSVSTCLIFSFFLLLLKIEQPIQALPRRFCCSSAVEAAVSPFVIRASDRKWIKWINTVYSLFYHSLSLCHMVMLFPFWMTWNAAYFSLNFCLLCNNIFLGSQKV